VVTVPKEEAARILFVDDDPDFVQITRTILSKEGFQVSSAASGDQALQAMQAKQPDLVLLDVMMATTPEGVSVARKMPLDPAPKDVPVIMISSIDSSQCADRLPDEMAVPIDAWISKPVHPDHLLRTVRHFVA
jgi:CheY-like chemotaxis protein